jgi:hypothetical protein
MTTAPPPKPPSKPPPKVNGIKDAIMIIDSDDEGNESIKAAPQPPPKAEFEDEEEELDPDKPYPSIIQQLSLSLNTAVIHIAVPQVPAALELRSADSIPPIFSKRIVFVVACADYSVRIVTLPLSPPPHATMERPPNASPQYGEDVIKIPTHAGHQAIPTGISVTWTSQGEPSYSQPLEDEMDVDGDSEGQGAVAPGRRSPRKKQAPSRTPTGGEGFDLLIASHSNEVGGLLKIWRFGLTDTSVRVTPPISPYQTLVLQKPAIRVAFSNALYPKRRHSRLLITDLSGFVRIYDPLASRKRRNGDSQQGAFVASFRTTFERTRANAPFSPVLAARKAIIAAAWAADGHHVVALLTDGEWGIWDIDRTGPNPPTDPSTFSFRGFVGTSESERSSSGPSSPKSRNSRSSLVPMTPNTRKRKEETLFHGSSPSSSIPTQGGISVTASPSVNGTDPEDSVIIWYGTDVYRIPDLARFWSRTVSNSSGSSLSGFGLSPVQGIPLLGEAITSVDQFDTTAKQARLAIPRDVIVAAEHRLIVISNTNHPLGRDMSALSIKEQVGGDETRRIDQVLLDRRELDLGGMDRLMEDMGTNGSASQSMVIGNPRKVLFATSAA